MVIIMDFSQCSLNNIANPAWEGDKAPYIIIESVGV